jgi:ribonuclease HII
MRTHNKLFPGYDLANNKGYGTLKHTAALYKQKHTIIHRQQFLIKLYARIKKDEYAGQQTIC